MLTDIQLVTQSGHIYTIRPDGSMGHGLTFVGISLHQWSRKPIHTLSDVLECLTLMSGAWLWYTRGLALLRLPVRVKAAWRSTQFNPSQDEVR